MDPTTRLPSAFPSGTYLARIEAILASGDPAEDQGLALRELLHDVVRAHLADVPVLLPSPEQRLCYLLRDAPAGLGSLANLRGLEPAAAAAAIRSVIGHLAGDAAPEGALPAPTRPDLGAAVSELRGILLGATAPDAAGAVDVTLATEGPFGAAVTVRLDPADGPQVAAARDLLSRLSDLPTVAFRQLVPCAAGPADLQAGPRTTMVLEPDLLLDVREVSECYQGPARRSPWAFLLRLFCPGTASVSALLGRVVNDLFDHLVVDPTARFEPLLERCLAETDPLELAVLPEGALDDLARRAREQLERLRAMAIALRPEHPRLEPTFLSARFGLQGRLDALYGERPGSPERNILELKSGSARDTGVWENHRMQVMGYHLLLRSTFPGRTGTSRIWYSRSEPGDAREVRFDPEAARDLLTVRNQAVFLLLELGRGQASVLRRLDAAGDDRFARFQLPDRRALSQAWRGASDLERDHLLELSAFLIREWRQEATGDRGNGDLGFAALWRAPDVAAKARAFAIVPYLTLVAFTPGTGEVTLARHPDHAGVTRFRAGDLVILYGHVDDQVRPLEQQLLKATVLSLGPAEVRLAVRNRMLAAADLQAWPCWAFERDFSDDRYQSGMQSLAAFLAHPDARRRRVLLGLEAPEFDPVVPLPDAIEIGLNDNQRDLVRRAAAARDYCLIQGPPGTGKTSTILPRITAHARDRNERVVIAAFTNRAVDEIHERLDRAGIAHVDLRRRGADRSSPDRAAALGEASVFLSTIAGLLKRRAALLSLIGRIDTLIIDEASQALEPELVGLCALAGRSVLIGDHLQLPPVVAQPEGTCRPASERLRAAGFTDLRLTLFERLWERCQAAGWTAATGMLETHFRMHADVAALVNPTYGGRLRAGTPAQTAPLAGCPEPEDPVERLLARHRAIFWPTSPSPHRDHPEEAGIVAALAATVRRVRGPAFGPETFGVVTPWRVQVNAIQRALPEALRDLVTVDTVERFQGMERDVIVLSLAVSHPGQLARLQSLSPDGRVDRKLNVALSRARCQVVILGCEQVLCLARPYADLIDRIRAAGGAVSSAPT